VCVDGRVHVHGLNCELELKELKLAELKLALCFWKRSGTLTGVLFWKRRAPEFCAP
jgi:hypothetical protein